MTGCCQSQNINTHGAKNETGKAIETPSQVEGFARPACEDGAGRIGSI